MAVINASGANAVCADILTQAQNEFTLTINTPETEATAFAPTIYSRSWRGRLTEWGATVRARLAPASLGSTAIISNGGALYNTNVRRWSLTLANNVHEATVFNATAPTHRSFANGIIDGSGNYEALVDDTTSLVSPPSAAASAVVFRYYDATTDHSLTFDCLATQLSAGFKVGDLAVANYSFKVSGNLTHAGSGTLTAPLFAAAMLSGSTVKLPAASSATFTAASGRTYSGSVLLERLTIDVPVDDLITLEYVLKGTGDLAIA